MSRHSAASLAVLNPYAPQPYPKAPASLSARRRKLWDAIVRSKSSDWFDEGSFPVLQALVAHIETLENIQAAFDTPVDLTDPEALDRLDKLSRLRDRESKAVATLSVKLRLTIQSRYTPQRASTDARPNSTRRPRERDDEGLLA